MGRRQLRVGRRRLRGRRAGGEDRRRARAPARAAHDRRHRPRGRRRPTRSRSTRSASAAAAATRPSSRRAPPRCRPRTPSPSSTPRAPPGPPKGCVLTHGNYRRVVTMLESAGAVAGRRGHLPLPPARPRLRAAHPARQLRRRHDRSPTSAATRTQIVPELQQVQPTYLPSVPRIFEKIYTLALRRSRPRSRRRMQAAAKLGVQVRDLQVRGEEVPAELRDAVRAGRGAALQERARDLRRAPAPGGHRRRADRPGDPRVLLRLRRAGARGLRDDRDGHGGHLLDAREPPVRHGRPRAAGRRGQDRRRRRAADQGRQHLPRLLHATTTRASARSTTAGCTPATSARSTRTATSPSRAARRTSSSPRAARTSRRPTSRTTSSRRAGSPRPSCTATAGPTR